MGALGRAWSPVTAAQLSVAGVALKHPSSFRVAGVALGDIHFCVAGVALMALTLRGRRGTWRHPTSFRVAGVALGDIHLRSAWQAWHLVTSTLALGDIHVRFAWQVWHLATSTFVSLGRCGTWSHSPSFCVADVALMALGWLWRAWARWGALGCR